MDTAPVPPLAALALLTLLAVLAIGLGQRLISTGEAGLLLLGVAGGMALRWALRR